MKKIAVGFALVLSVPLCILGYGLFGLGLAYVIVLLWFPVIIYLWLKGELPADF
jgi:hypothetical protein